MEHAADLASYREFRTIRSYYCNAANELSGTLIFRNIFEHLEDLGELLRISGILTAESG